jgi:hypothetical protein
MTALRKDKVPSLNLGRRGRDEVWTPRPCGGEHKKLVRSGLANTVAQHGETLKKLAKV